MTTSPTKVDAPFPNHDKLQLNTGDGVPENQPGLPQFKDQMRQASGPASRVAQGPRPIESTAPVLAVAVPVDGSIGDAEIKRKTNTADSVHCGCKLKRSNIRWIIVLAVVIIAAVALSVALILAKNDRSTQGSNDEVSLNGQTTRTPQPTASVNATKTTAPSTEPVIPQPTSPTMDERAESILNFLNIISFSSPHKYPVDSTQPTPEELALAWLIDEDVLQFSADSAVGQFRIQQRYAVTLLWFQLSGSEWRERAGWLTNAHECDWSHIFCVERNVGPAGVQRIVSSLAFDSSRVQGQIPADLALLSNDVQVLDFSDNFLTGTLPESFGQLTGISIIDLSENSSLGGTIPASMTDWPDIRSVFFYDTSFTGTLPFCSRNRSYIRVVVDCPEVECPCCTDCCPAANGAIPEFTGGNGC